jgi:hypothetical protein
MPLFSLIISIFNNFFNYAEMLERKDARTSEKLNKVQPLTFFSKVTFGAYNSILGYIIMLKPGSTLPCC